MKKLFNPAFILLLVFAMTACGQTVQNEADITGDKETSQVTEVAESIQEEESATVSESAAPGIEEESVMKAAFDFETKTVTLNSGYEMPINGLGTYSLHGNECINAVKYALSNGVRLIDTASAYGNEAEIGQAIREAIGEGIIRREDIFVITKIYPGDEMKNPERSVQACLDRLDIGYVDMMLLHHPDANDVKAYNVIEQFVADGNFRNRRSVQRIIRTSHFAVEPAKKCGRDSRFR